MPVVFRPARPSRRVTGGRRRFPWSISPIRTTVGVAAGVATASAVGVAIKAFTGTTAGAATVSGVGVAIKEMAGSAAGAASVSGTGAALMATTGVAAGVATVDGRKLERAITGTNIMQKPVDYALAGQQLERQRIGKRALHHAFGE